MIISVKNLTGAELSEVSGDLAKIITKKKNKGAAYLFWHELLKGIIAEYDNRIASEDGADQEEA